MSERELENSVRAILTGLSLRWYHTHFSRRSPSGFPDLVIVGCRVIYRELKTEKGRVSEEQREWLHNLTAAGGDAAVWRPSALLSGEVAAELTAISKLRRAA